MATIHAKMQNLVHSAALLYRDKLVPSMVLKIKSKSQKANENWWQGSESVIHIGKTALMQVFIFLERGGGCSNVD